MASLPVARSRAGFCSAVIHGHLDVDGHAGFAVGQFLNTHDLGYIFEIRRIVRRAEGEVTKTHSPIGVVTET